VTTEETVQDAIDVAEDRIEQMRAAARQRWAALTPEQRSVRTARGRYAADTRWERQADPDGSMSPDERAVAGARLRDAHYRERGVIA
jgi:hypothetical protein